MALADCGLFLHQNRTFPLLKSKSTCDLSRFVADGIILRGLLGILSAGIFVTLALVSGKSTDVKLLILFLALTLIVNNIMGGFTSLIYSFERFKLFGVLSSATQFLTTALSIAAIIFGFGLIGIGAAQLLIAIIAAAVCAHFARKYLAKPAEWSFGPRIILLLKDSIPLGVVAILVMFYHRANFAMVSLFCGDQEAGFYNAAFTVVNSFVIISATLGSMLLPRFSSYHSKNTDALRNLYQRSLRLLLIAGIGIGAGMVVLARPITELLFSPTYSSSVTPLSILVWVSALMLPGAVQQSLLMAAAANRALVRMIAVAAIGNVALSLILISRFGMIGAAVAMVASEAYIFTAGFLAHRRILPGKLLISYATRTLAAAAIMTACIKLLDIDILFVNIAIGAVAYLLALFLFKGLLIADLQTFRRRR